MINVTLTGSRMTEATNLWAGLWGMKRLGNLRLEDPPEYEQHQPMHRGPDLYKKEREKEQSTDIHLCQILGWDAVWPTALGFHSHAFRTMMTVSPPTVSQRKPFLP